MATVVVMSDDLSPGVNFDGWIITSSVKLPLADIVFGGSGANRTVTITSAANLTGTATITFTVTDEGGLTDYTAFSKPEGYVRPFGLLSPQLLTVVTSIKPGFMR